MAATCVKNGFQSFFYTKIQHHIIRKFAFFSVLNISKYKTRNSRNIPKYKTRNFKVRYRKKYFLRLHKLETAV
jgi:hypothetical protein